MTFWKRYGFILLGLSFAQSPATSASSVGTEIENSFLKCPAVHSDQPMVSPPPKATPLFYRKFINVNGVSILGSDRVCDRTLQIAYQIVVHMLSRRPEFQTILSHRAARVAIFAVTEKLTDLPEERDLGEWRIDEKQRNRTYDQACGGGGGPRRPTAVCEKNLIHFQDPYLGKASILIHEFAHTIQENAMDPILRAEITNAYQNAKNLGLFKTAKGDPSYMMSNEKEFFAEATSIWFNSADSTNPVNSPHQIRRSHLKIYDSELYQILEKIYPDDDWHYPRR